MRKIKILSVILVTLLLITSCGTSKNKDVSTSSHGNQDKKLEEVDIVLDWYPNAIHSFIYAAIEKGYFEEEGIKVNVQFPSNATDPLTLPAAGKATVGIYYQPDVIIARANENIPIKSIGAVVHEPLSVVISLKEKNIKRPKDLEGKIVGYSGNLLNEKYVKTMVEKDGGDPSKVEIIDIGFEILSSMVTKKVDATTGGLINHEVPVMEHEGLGVNYFDPSDYGVPKYYEMVFVANDKTINNERDKLEKFLRGAKKGFEFMKENPDEALDILLKNQQKDSFPLTKSIEKQSLDILLSKMDSEEEPFLSQTKKSWEDKSKWLREKGMIEKGPDIDELFINILNK